MGSLTDTSENDLLDHIFNAAYSPVASVYLVLSTSDPTDAATGGSCNEHPDTGAYARTAITFSAAATRKVDQSANVQFPKASAAWSTISHWCIADNAGYGLGDILAAGAFTSSFSPVQGNTVQVASGEIYVQVDATSGGAGFVTAEVHRLLDLMFRNQAYAKPDTYIALATAVLDDLDGTVADTTEMTGTGYARELVDINGGASPTWDLAAAGALANTHQIDIGPPTVADWGLLTSMFIATTISGAGNVICYDNDNIVDQTPGANDEVRFEIGDLDVTLT